jgi:hypothetical protein
MKTIKLLTTALLMIVFVQSTLAKAQKTGLYLTAEDFLNHKISYESDGSNGTKIQLHELFEGYNVVVIQNGKRQAFSKSAISGTGTTARITGTLTTRHTGLLIPRVFTSIAPAN